MIFIVWDIDVMSVCVHMPKAHYSLLSGNSYSNPSNNFWKLLRTGRIVPEEWSVEDCPRMPEELGIGGAPTLNPQPALIGRHRITDCV